VKCVTSDAPVRQLVSRDLRLTRRQPPSGPRRGGWQPVMRAVAERWLDLAFVIDDGPSTQIWRATTQELRRLLEGQA
jgi:hypothetical protein